MNTLRLASVLLVLIVVLVGCNSGTSLPTTPGTSVTPTTPTNPGSNSPLANGVVIYSIMYKGDPSRDESNEYVEIRNEKNVPADITGWVLKNQDNEKASFTFPSYILEPGQMVRVFTNEVHPESGGFSFGSKEPIWSNTEGNTAVLYNAEGQWKSRRSY